jgi:hypothetical protein
MQADSKRFIHVYVRGYGFSLADIPTRKANEFASRPLGFVPRKCARQERTAETLFLGTLLFYGQGHLLELRLTHRGATAPLRCL